MRATSSSRHGCVPRCALYLTLPFLVSSRAYVCALSVASTSLPGAAESAYVKAGVPLRPTPLSAAASALRQCGVVRIDGVLPREDCAALREHVLELRVGAEARSDKTTGVPTSADKRHVPGTRLRFGEAVELPMEGNLAFGRWTRNDVLLPLEDVSVAATLRTVGGALRGVMRDAEACLPSTRSESSDDFEKFELVELAALVARPGAGHQNLHADFKHIGYTAVIPEEEEEEDFGLSDDIWAKLGGSTPELSVATAAAPLELPKQMPPRFVTFLYLQDVPTAADGATVFLPDTANAASHANLLGDDGLALLPSDQTIDTLPVAALGTLSAGDAVIFDASTLHFGGAKEKTSVPHERVVFYFGVAREGGAAEHDGGTSFGSSLDSDVMPPVTFSECLSPIID